MAAWTRWSDEKVEQFMAALLRAGVVTAAVVVFIGGVLYVAQEGTTLPQYRTFHGEPSALRNVSGILADARALRALGIIQLGLLVLIATPVARVAFALVAFALQRDRTYVIVTLVVLSILAYGLVTGEP
jgi:uncharacterized membrane protein